jgi:hypothetical protein
MAHLKARQYQMVFADLLEKRLEPLRRLSGAQHLEPAVRRQSEEIDALLADGAVEEADGVKELVRLHIDATAALFHRLEAVRRNPRARDDRKQAAGRVHTTVLAGRMSTRRTAVERATDAHDVGPKRQSLERDFLLLPVGEDSVAVLVDDWVDAGEQIGRALSGRSGIGDVGPRTERDVLRETARLMGRIRKAIRVDLEVNPALPVNLEAQILGYLDELSRPRRRRASGASTATSAVAAPPPPPIAEAPVPVGPPDDG